MQSDRETVEKLIAAKSDAIRDSLLVRLALARTYCQTARLAKHPAKRQHLFTLACKTLTEVEQFAAAASPKLPLAVLEEAERLRFEIRQLSADAHPD